MAAASIFVILVARDHADYMQDEINIGSNILGHVQSLLAKEFQT